MKNRISAAVGWLRRPHERLSGRVVTAGVWSIALRVVVRSVGLIRAIVLARLLGPHEFGLMGIAALTLSLLETFSSTGFSAALVQRRGDIRGHLDTAWTIELIRNAALAALLFLAAPACAGFFEAPEATLVLRVMAASLVVAGVRNIGVVFFWRDLQFRQRFVLEASRLAVEIAVAIPVALLFRNVWALVSGALVGTLAHTALSYALHPYRPRLRFDPAKAREMFRFGKWVFASSVLLYLLLNLDDIVVGRVLGIAALGLYQVAYTMSQAPTTELTRVVGGVMFPAFAALQQRKAELARAYVDVVKVVGFLTFPLATAIIALGPAFVVLALGESWVPLTGALQLLAIWGLIRSLAATTGPLFQATGRPHIATAIQAVKLAVFLPLVYPLTVNRGLAGAALATVVAAVLVDPFALWIAWRRTGADLRAYSRALAFPLFGAAAMLGGVWSLVRAGLRPERSFLELAVGACVAGGCYLAAMSVVERLGGYGLIETLARPFRPPAPHGESGSGGAG